MPIADALSTLLSRFKFSTSAAKKTVWGKHSHIDMLAEGLTRDREGWVLGSNALHRNGVDIVWSGSLTAAGTSVKVKMDGQQFTVTAAENLRLKEALSRFLEERHSVLPPKLDP